uniref:EGF-like domain-containing protein n=1 Tax=Panagrolaimus sp. JU765 TaxID=591449 RepID=A0AC34QLB6_9BILA
MLRLLFFILIFVNVVYCCDNCTDYGNCMNQNADGTCSLCACPEGFGGDCCEIPPPYGCDLNPCSDTNSTSQHFNCDNLENGLRLCTCSEGWTGDKCDKEIDGCNPNPCQNSGDCTKQNNGGYQCKCKKDYTGTMCQTYMKCNDWWVNCGCKSNPCKNNGTCIEKFYGNYECQCVNQNYTGDKCEKIPCQTNPCEHGGHCYTDPDGKQTCMCLSIWTGDNCENFDKCGFDKCYNGGTCSINKKGDVQCACVKGYEGPRCENITNNCEPNPCQFTYFGSQKGYANCTNLIGDYECDCPEGTSGKSCEINHDDCWINGQNPCTSVDWKANCTDGLNDYRCFCGPDYTGQNCSMSIIVWEVLKAFGGSQTYEKTELEIEKDIIKTFDTTLGNCFTFNHEQSQKTYKFRTGGAPGGFKTLMRVRQDEYLQWYDTAALLVFVHPQDETIFSESVRYQVAPNRSVQIITNKITYARLSGKYGVCIENKDDVKSYYYSGKYTTSGCLRSCYQDAVYEQCSCMDP